MSSAGFLGMELEFDKSVVSPTHGFLPKSPYPDTIQAEFANFCIVTTAVEMLAKQCPKITLQIAMKSVKHEKTTTRTTTTWINIFITCVSK